MKDQYVGDENDYVKYGLLRLLARPPVRLVVDWMRTADDGRPDGVRIAYLDRPERWEGFDPELFRGLREIVRTGNRSLRAVEEARLLQGALFFSDPVPEDAVRRAARLGRLSHFARAGNLLFLDPDNGLAVRSVPCGCAGSSKYLYPSEVAALHGTSLCLLVYQHFPRRKRTPFIADTAARCLADTGASSAFSFRTRHAVFFLLPHPGAEQLFRDRARAVERAWYREIRVEEHLPGSGPPDGTGRQTPAGPHAPTGGSSEGGGAPALRGGGR